MKPSDFKQTSVGLLQECLDYGSKEGVEGYSVDCDVLSHGITNEPINHYEKLKKIISIDSLNMINNLEEIDTGSNFVLQTTITGKAQILDQDEEKETPFILDVNFYGVNNQLKQLDFTNHIFLCHLDKSLIKGESLKDDLWRFESNNKYFNCDAGWIDRPQVIATEG